MSNIAALLERLRAATGPDRYADCHLWVLAQGGDARMYVCDSSTQDFIWEKGIDGFWVRGVVKFRAVPRYTASVDAAVALTERMLPGWQLSHGSLTWTFGFEGERVWTCNLRAYRAKDHGHTAPLAILAALLSALKDQPHD